MPHDAVLCPHYGTCGGCSRQHVDYPEQLLVKAQYLRDLFSPCYHFPVPVIPSPVIWHYRNKIDPSFAPKRYPEPPPPGFVRETVLGFKQAGKWFHPLAIDTCLIGPERVRTLLDQLRRWYESGPIPAYDSRRGTGILRSLLVREGKRSGERMVVLITTPRPSIDLRPFVDITLASFSPVCIYHGEYSGRAEVAAADRLNLLHGEKSIREILRIPESMPPIDSFETSNTPAEYLQTVSDATRVLEFRISPLSFFQTNPLAAERLYGWIRRWASQIRPVLLLDLYGGTGGIAMACADLVQEIVSVENCSDATKDGQYNVRRNGISNVTFVTDSVQNYLKERLEGAGLPPRTAAIIDPPRSGLHPKAVSRLMRLKPEHILYVSCNPKCLAKELPVFLEEYHLTELAGVDMFPHTEHVECLAALVIKRS